MENLPVTELTVEELNLILDALEAYLKATSSSVIANAFLESVMSEEMRNSPVYAAYKRKEEEKMRKEKAEEVIRDENIKMLQGKLILLKRQLHEKSAINEVNSILDNNKK